MEASRRWSRLATVALQGELGRRAKVAELDRYLHELEEELRARGLWPAQMPTGVLTEALTGDHRRDFHVNRLLRTCQIRPVDEARARRWIGCPSVGTAFARSRPSA